MLVAPFLIIEMSFAIKPSKLGTGIFLFFQTGGLRLQLTFQA